MWSRVLEFPESSREPSHEKEEPSDSGAQLLMCYNVRPDRHILDVCLPRFFGIARGQFCIGARDGLFPDETIFVF